MFNVLIIEDEPAIAETLIYAFKEMGMQATHKQLGSDALIELNHHTYDFVLLDVGLPDMSGFDVCKKIRENSQIPLLFLTARNHEIDRIVGLEIGADDYVTKPFSPREVVTRVKAILRRTENRADLAKSAKKHLSFCNRCISK
jgi:two-component system catabolic regulation response regulator CreB